MSPEEEPQGQSQTKELRWGLGELGLTCGGRGLTVGRWQVSVPSHPHGMR